MLGRYRRCVTLRESRLLALLFFFFQAEDGIRDWSVTGVQTCALPICAAPVPLQAACESSAHSRLGLGEHELGDAVGIVCDEIGRASCREKCRSRWSPYH